MTDVVRGGGGGAGFLPEGGYWMGTTEETGRATTGEPACAWPGGRAPAGDDRLRLSGRAAWPYFSPGVSSLGSQAGSTGASERGGLLEVLVDGSDTEAGDVNVSGSGRLSEETLLGRSDAEPPVDEDDSEPPRLWLSPGCARLMIRAHVATLMFIWL